MPRCTCTPALRDGVSPHGTSGLAPSRTGAGEATGDNAGEIHPYLNVFKPMAMTNLNVNYTPDGTYMTYNETGSVTSYDLQMSFGELEPIYSDEFDDSNDDDYEYQESDNEEDVVYEYYKLDHNKHKYFTRSKSKKENKKRKFSIAAQKEIEQLKEENNNLGMGIIGEMNEFKSELNFLEYLKLKMDITKIRHSNLLGKKIKKIAVLGGSGSFGIEEALTKKADCYVTADLKYHDFFKSNKKLLLVDIGHYESEKYTKDLILNYLNKKIPKFACIIAKTRTNPVNYF